MSVSFKLEVKISFDVKFRQAAHLVKMGSLVLFLFVLFVSTRQLDAFCGMLTKKIMKRFPLLRLKTAGKG